ncbi:MAG TPA: hypothetical protein VMW10_02920 [Alphaproteobacteria bacterium]|nr:hypothetical protein [Alphaproteobacteria bacterium]
MKISILFETFFYIISTVFLLNIYDAKADECGCVICQPKDDLKKKLPIKNITSDDFNALKITPEELCAENFLECPVTILPDQSVSYSCYAGWRNVSVGECPPDNTCN